MGTQTETTMDQIAELSNSPSSEKCQNPINRESDLPTQDTPARRQSPIRAPSGSGPTPNNVARSQPAESPEMS